MSKQVAVWLDHTEARIFHIQPGSTDATILTAPTHVAHTHPFKGSEGTKAHQQQSQRFYHDVVHTLAGTESLLIVGPSTAKLEFIRYLHQHDLTLESKVVGVETVDHPTDRQLVAYAKEYFDLNRH